MIDREHELPVVRQCRVLKLSRSSVYYQARNPQEPWTAEREQHAEHALQTMLASLEPFLATDSAEVAA